jgi:hypothetical protein
MSVSQGTVIKSFISAIDFLDQREIDKNLYDQSRDRALTDVMRLAKRYKETAMPSYHNFVNNDTWEVGTISAVASTGLAQIQFTINTAAGFPRVGDLIKTSNALNVGKQARIQVVSFTSSTAVITARSVNNTPLWATVGDFVQFGSNAFAEKSTAPTNRRYGVTKAFNLTQIFREVDDITDIQKTSKIEVTVEGQPYVLPIQHIQKLIKFNGDITVQMIAGVMSTTQYSDANPFLADPVSGLPIQTTGGLDWYITTYGVTDQAAVLGTFNFTTVDDMIDNWIANKAPLNQMGLMASKPKRLIDQYFKNVGSSGMTSGRMILDGRTIDVNVDHLSYGGAELDFVHLPILDHPQLFGPTLTPEMNGSIYWIPKDEVEIVGGGRQARMLIRYQPSPFSGANGSSNGIMKEWRTGAMAEIPTSSEMVLHTDWYTSQGLECLGVKHFQRYRIV